MNIIKNDTELTKSFTFPGLQETADLDLPAVTIQGARSVVAEQQCRDTYHNGNSVAAVLKQNLIKTFECMNDTSQTLEETDQQVQKNSTISWADKLILK